MTNRMAFLSAGALALWAVSSTIATPTKNTKAKTQSVITVTTEVIPLASTTVGQVSPITQSTSVTTVSSTSSNSESFTVLIESKGSESKAIENKDVSPKTVLQVENKPTLGDAFIYQNNLQVSLDRPLTISLYNAQGQLIYHQDSQRKVENIPLQGIQAGFLYLTMRAGNAELTKKLLYTGR